VAEVDPNFALVYNKSMFAEVGLDPAMPPTTIADFDAANQKLLKKTGSTIARMGSTPPWSVYGDPNTLLTWFTQFGGGFIDSNGKLAVAGAENTSALDWIAAYARTYDFAAVTGLHQRVRQVWLGQRPRHRPDRHGPARLGRLHAPGEPHQERRHQLPGLRARLYANGPGRPEEQGMGGRLGNISARRRAAS